MKSFIASFHITNLRNQTIIICILFQVVSFLKQIPVFKTSSKAAVTEYGFYARRILLINQSIFLQYTNVHEINTISFYTCLQSSLLHLVLRLVHKLYYCTFTNFGQIICTVLGVHFVEPIKCIVIKCLSKN